MVATSFHVCMITFGMVWWLEAGETAAGPPGGTPRQLPACSGGSIRGGSTGGDGTGGDDGGGGRCDGDD